MSEILLGTIAFIFIYIALKALHKHFHEEELGEMDDAVDRMSKL